MTTPVSAQEDMKAWLIERIVELPEEIVCIAIGTEDDAYAKALSLGLNERNSWISGPYDFTIAVKP